MNRGKSTRLVHAPLEHLRYPELPMCVPASIISIIHLLPLTASEAVLDMSFQNEVSPWAVSPTESSKEPTVESALEKEKVIKDIITLRDGLRSLLVRITEVEGDNDKLKRENEMLATYVENL